ncbi:MAG: DUF1223 domain-containing protein, partial [Bacteroidota bacterium]
SVAVVELFTSQGCSSCPSADKNLSQLITNNTDRMVFGLSFHVSYWNYLGWKDPYSKEVFTERQRKYAAKFANSSIYTPHLSVNGKEEFVGSKQVKTKQVIERSLSQQTNHTINAQLKVVGDRLEVLYDIEGEHEGYVLNIALVERNLQTKILRGENQHKTLHHDNVVREFTTQKLSASGRHSIDIPPGLSFSNTSVILYTQRKTSFEITGASAVDLPL